MCGSAKARTLSEVIAEWRPMYSDMSQRAFARLLYNDGPIIVNGPGLATIYGAVRRFDARTLATANTTA